MAISTDRGVSHRSIAVSGNGSYMVSLLAQNTGFSRVTQRAHIHRIKPYILKHGLNTGMHNLEYSLTAIVLGFEQKPG